MSISKFLEEILHDAQKHQANGPNKKIKSTHISMFNPKTSFIMSIQHYDSFMRDYQQGVKNGEEFGIMERPLAYIPVLADVDLKLEIVDGEDFPTSLYDMDQVEQLIGVYQRFIRATVVNCTDDMLTCVLLEKKHYVDNSKRVSYVKNGFHLHFPNVWLTPNEISVYILYNAHKYCEENPIFTKYKFEGTILDKAACCNSWLMYGSTKSAGREPYKVTKVYDNDCKEISLAKAFGNFLIYNDSDEKIIFDPSEVEDMLPRILSINCRKKITHKVKSTATSLSRDAVRPPKRKMIHEDIIDVNKNIEMAKELLPMLSIERSTDYHEWIRMSFLLWNISEGSTEGLDMWCAFSERSTGKYSEAECIVKWDNITEKGPLTIGTLHYMASVDSPEKYSTWKKNAKSGSETVNSAIYGSHNDIAKILYNRYKNRYICASFSGGIWFEYRNHIWEQIEEGVYLRKKISNEVVKEFSDYGSQVWKELAELKDQSLQGTLKEKQKQITKMVLNLKTSGYKNNVMRECMEEFYDRRFREKLDTNPILIAFKNGVYDIERFVLRDGVPEDYISKQLPINYVEFKDDDPKVLDVRRFLEQVFPDTSVRKYFLDCASDIFRGGNPQKIVLIWSGEGDNGKSITQNIFEKMMGKLAIKLNTTVVTGKKVQSGAANADLARAGGGVRWAVMEEPGGDEMINDGILNNLSGNDTFYARDLFEKGKDGREITPMFKLIFICNKLPKLRYNLKATWNRLRVIPFESTFVRPEDPNGVPDTYEEQLRQKRFPMDKEFSAKIPGMLEAFAYILIEHAKTLVVDGKPVKRKQPTKVTIATEDYKTDNDDYLDYINIHIVKDPESPGISAPEVYRRFKEHYREGLPGHKIPVKKDVIRGFTKKWGDVNKRGLWVGYRFRRIDENIDDKSDDKSGGDGGDVDDAKSGGEFVDYEDAKSFLPM